MSKDKSATLSIKEEALVGIAASVAAGCQPCTRRWSAEAHAAGACKRGIRLAVETGLAVQASATSAMAEFAASLQTDSPIIDEAFRSERAKLIEVMACGAAFAVRSTTDLQQHIDIARSRSATQAQMGAAMVISRAVSVAAVKEVENLVRDVGLDNRAKITGNWCCNAASETAPLAKAGCSCNGDRS